MRRLLLGAALGAALATAGAALAKDDPARLLHGHDVFQYWCATCHGAGPDHPGTQALQAKYRGSKPAALEDRTDLTADQARFYVRHGVSIMPFFRKTEITDAELDALGAYLSRQHR